MVSSVRARVAARIVAPGNIGSEPGAGSEMVDDPGQVVRAVQRQDDLSFPARAQHVLDRDFFAAGRGLPLGERGPARLVRFAVTTAGPATTRIRVIPAVAA